MTRSTMLLTTCVLAAACFMGACGGDGSSTPSAQSPGSQAAATAEVPGSVDESPTKRPGGVAIPLVPQPKVARLAEAVADAIVRRRAMEAPFIEQFRRSFEERVSREKKLSALLTDVYAQSGYRFVFADGSHLKPGAAELLRLVEELPSHGVSLDPYPVTQLRELMATYEATSVAYKDAKKKELDGPAGKLRTLFELVRGEPTAAQLEPGLLEAGLSDDDIGALEQVVALHNELFEAKRQLNDVLQKLDIRLLDAYFRYALDFRHVKVAHPWRAMKNPGGAHKAFHKKLLADLEQGKDAVDATLRSWWPQNPLYEKTRVGLAFYQKLAEEKRFVELPSRTYRKGQSGEHVKSLQQRLMVEGYYAGPLNGVFDAAVDQAVRTYQATHQLDVDGIVAAGMLRSLNKPFKDRAEDIRLSLQRWRESATRGEEGLYIRVNIPQFQAEFWEDGKLLRRFNVVVGSNAWEVDPDRSVEGNLNRTMLFSSDMETIVLNPKWNVPSRIKQTELDVKAGEDETWWDRNNYVVETREDGSQLVYQKPGPWNALGLVKFLFPNDYSIYMHDTNRRDLFKNTIRAYSHGCMRVENALEMARFIFEKDGRLTSDKFDAVMKTRTERGFALRTKIPVHVEYNTVSVDDAGHMMFFLDVYKYDQAFREGQVPLRGAKPIAREG